MITPRRRTAAAIIVGAAAVGGLLGTTPGNADAKTYHQGAYDNQFHMTITTSPGKVQVTLDNQLDRGVNCEWAIGRKRYPDFAVARGTKDNATATDVPSGLRQFWSKCRSHTDGLFPPKYDIKTQLMVDVPDTKKVVKLAPKPKEKDTPKIKIPKIDGPVDKVKIKPLPKDITDPKPAPEPTPATPKSPLDQLLEAFGS